MARIFENDKSVIEMGDKNRIKVALICHFSDDIIRNQLAFRRRKKDNPLFHKDFAVWISNAIKQYENYKDIEFSVIFPHPGIKGLSKSFEINGIKYFCFRPEDDFIISNILNLLFRWRKKYRYNRFQIKRVIKKTKPDIIHLIGAENPYYSLSILDVPDSIPCLVTLQTLMSVPGFYDNFTLDSFSYSYRSYVEKQVLQRVNYIGCPIDKFKEQVLTYIKKDAICLDVPLATGQDIDNSPCKKQYDFVYFSNDISKASDWAIEAFAIALKKFPNLSLNISGFYSQQYKSIIDEKIKKLGISNNVFITGPKKTHQEVIEQIKKARFAILPLKVDLISTTIREAMACGLPTITTTTEATPDINNEVQSILLAAKGDIEGMANQIIALVSDNSLCETLSSNALTYARNHFSNEIMMEKVHQIYKDIYARHYKSRN